MINELQREIINIFEEDEITSVIDKLLNSKSSRVIFAVSKDSKIFKNLINLKLLKREAENIGKEIGIFTFDENDRRLIKKIGIDVYDKLIDNKVPDVKIEDEEFFAELFETKEEAEKKLRNKNPDSLSGTSRTRRMADIIVGKPILKIGENLKEGNQEVESMKPEAKKEQEIFLPKESREKIEQFLKLKKKPLIEKDNISKVEEELISRHDKIRPAFNIYLIKKLFSGIFKFFSSKFFTLILIFSFAIAGLTLYFILPQAKILITPKKDKGVFSFSIVADKTIFDIDYENTQIPAQTIEMEKTLEAEFVATGRKNLEEKSKGEITIYNAYSSSPQTLVAQTRFESPEGNIFRITRTVIVPGAKIEAGKIFPAEIDADVIADIAGPEYNISPSNFTIPGFKGSPKFDGFYAKSKLPMVGGFKGEAIVITEEDLQKAKEEFEKNLVEKIKIEFLNKIPASLKLIDGAELINIEYVQLPKVGDHMEKFTIDAKGKISAILFNENDLNKFIDEKIMKQLSENKLQLTPTRQYDYSVISFNFKDGKLNFSLRVSEDISEKIDTDYIKDNLSGKSENQIKDFFSKEENVENVRVIFWPFWVSAVSENKNKIKILVDEIGY